MSAFLSWAKATAPLQPRARITDRQRSSGFTAGSFASLLPAREHSRHTQTRREGLLFRHGCLLLGGSGPPFVRRAALHVALGNLAVEPEAVVLARPVDVDLAAAHRLECAFHADGADVDMREHDGDEND